METITIHKAKTQLSRLIEKACQGEEIVIARGKEPVVKLVPACSPQKAKAWAWKGKNQIGPECLRSFAGPGNEGPWLRMAREPGDLALGLTVLLDTHTLIWCDGRPDRLSKRTANH